MSADDLLPSNAVAFERSLSGAQSRLLAADTDAIRRSRQPAQCAAAFVPLLAWERSVHFYDPADAAGNRARIASAFTDHCHYGSPPALAAEIALDTGQNVHLVEYHEERDLVWPEFVVESVINPGDPMPDLDALKASALARKNVRDWPGVRTHVVQPPAPLDVGAAHRLMFTIRAVTTPPPPAPFVAATHRLMPTYRIPPL